MVVVAQTAMVSVVDCGGRGAGIQREEIRKFEMEIWAPIVDLVGVGWY